MSLQLLGGVTGFTVELSLLSCSLPTLTHTLIQHVLCFFNKNVKEFYSSKAPRYVTMLIRAECMIDGLIGYHCL